MLCCTTFISSCQRCWMVCNRKINSFRTALSGDHSRHSLNEKPDRSAHTRIVVRPRFDVTELHQGLAISARDGKAAHAPWCISATVCWRRLLLFLLTGLLRLLRLLGFLSHVALHGPKVGSMQIDLDMHKHRVHHNCRIDTVRFEEGKRRSKSWVDHPAEGRLV